MDYETINTSNPISSLIRYAESIRERQDKYEEMRAIVAAGIRDGLLKPGKPRTYTRYNFSHQQRREIVEEIIKLREAGMKLAAATAKFKIRPHIFRQWKKALNI